MTKKKFAMLLQRGMFSCGYIVEKHYVVLYVFCCLKRGGAVIVTAQVCKVNTRQNKILTRINRLHKNTPL